jgi:hypothetical protein
VENPRRARDPGKKLYFDANYLLNAIQVLPLVYARMPGQGTPIQNKPVFRTGGTTCE